MGVPKFFRWISERYPCLSEVVREYQIPEFDNLYLDMNGIIHTCSHPNDNDPHFRISEEKIFKDIFHYIEVLFRIIQPRKLFFMAIDGVAPRAKMNQQRGRRFRSAQDAVNLEKKAAARGEKLPEQERFDSNCITPGTVFMARLQEQLKYFVSVKMSTDALWRGVKVILSGHNTPGEGEHKIMDYIRYMKAQPGYDSNTRHCLYGLDADLIMLGMCTHEPHFSLLREEVKFGRKRTEQRASAPEEQNFYLLHLSLLREYLEHEFGALKGMVPFPFDLERIIDDWVLMGFLVGNDFIPPLPDLHIINGALPMLYRAYIEVLPTLGGYINEGGTLNLPRFEKYMEKLSAFDIAQFRDTYADLKFLQAKRRMRSKNSQTNGLSEDADDGEEDKNPIDPELAALIQASEILCDSSSEDGEGGGDDDDDDDKEHTVEDLFDLDGIDCDPDESEGDNTLFLTEFGHHKRHYYKSKMEFRKVTPEVLRSQAECYVRAIQWNLNYYYNGVCSWSWFYPHHYAPFISDIRKFSNLKLEFELGEPFLPFQQLLAVLPALSKQLLPEAYQSLMVDENSPIISYYPSTFRTDLNGKKQEWEAVVLIPFIDERNLLEAMKPGDQLLTEEERQRNKHGPMLMYTYSDEDLGPYDCSAYFPTLEKNYAMAHPISREEIYVHPSKLVKGLLPGVKLDVYFPGFPTLKHIQHTASLQKKRVKVFQDPSLGENMILRITNTDKPDLKSITHKLLGKTIFVDWPHLLEARVVAVASKDVRHTLVEGDSSQDKENSQESSVPQYNVEELKGNTLTDWNAFRNGIQERYMGRLGVDVGTTHILVTAATIVGRKYVFGKNGRITLEKQWNPNKNTYALQATVQDLAVYDPTFMQYKTLEEVFPPKSTVFLLAHPHYGSMGEVVDCGKNYAKSGRVKVNMTVTMEPSLEDIQKRCKDIHVSYMPGAVAAQRIAISPHLLSRITGTIYIVHGPKELAAEKATKTNVGLNLKFNKKNEEIPGYTHKVNGVWCYSQKAVELVKSYMSQFPELFEYLNYHTGNDIFYESDIYPHQVGTGKIEAISKWLKEQPYFSIERQTCGAELVEPEVVQELEKKVDEFYSNYCKVKTVTMQVKPYLLYKPVTSAGCMSPDQTTSTRLLDRVVCVRQCYTVPLGLKGTIIAINKEKKEEDYLFDIVFDKPFAGGLTLNCSKNRGYRCSRSTFINLSHGQRTEQVKSVVKPSNSVQSVGYKTSDFKPPLMADPPSAFATWNTGGGMYSASHFNMPKAQVPQFMPMPMMPPPNMHQHHRQPVPMVLMNSQPPPPQPHSPMMKAQASTPASSSSPATEFQQLWSQLQKAAIVDTSSNTQKPPTTVTPKPPTAVTPKAPTTVTPKTPTTVTPKPPTTVKSPLTPRQEVSDTSTDLLKKMLRIPDEPVQPPPQQRNTTVQDNVEMERGYIKRPVQGSCASLLLESFQRRGIGVPLYTYIQNPNDGSWTAQVMCNCKLVTGASAADKDQAAENVSMLALAMLGIPVPQPPPKSSSDVLPKPVTNNLPTPPQQWYQQQYTNHKIPQQPFRHGQQRPEPGRSHPQQFPPRPQQGYIPPFGVQPQHHNHSWPPQHPQQQHQQQPTNWRQESRPNFLQQQSFVPLQAVKQQHRNRTVSKQQEVPLSAQNQQQSNVTNKDVPLTASSAAQADSSKEQSTSKASTPASESSTPKPVVTRQRKCRIAANFSNVNP